MDIETINSIAGTVSAFADKVIAHLDQNGAQESVTYADLENSINLFNKTTCKYITLIKGEGYTTLKPSIINDWTKIFTVPFEIREDEEF